MTSKNQTPIEQWTVKQAILLAGVCLAAGIAGGWAIHAAQTPTTSGQEQAASGATGMGVTGSPASQASNTARLRAMADAQAAPQLQQLKSYPGNAELLIGLGNTYYDAQQYPVAVDYYERELKLKPSDAAVRTDLGTAYWYMGNADSAIAEFKQALSYAPTNPNTLFNLGLVEWKGKRDGVSAIADWEKLLASNPGYEGRDKVEQMMSEARKASVDNAGR